MPTCTEPSAFGAVASLTGVKPPLGPDAPPSLTNIASTFALLPLIGIASTVDPFFSSVPRITAWLGVFASRLIPSGAYVLIDPVIVPGVPCWPPPHATIATATSTRELSAMACIVASVFETLARAGMLAHLLDHPRLADLRVDLGRRDV